MFKLNNWAHVKERRLALHMFTVNHVARSPHNNTASDKKSTSKKESTSVSKVTI